MPRWPPTRRPSRCWAAPPTSSVRRESTSTSAHSSSSSAACRRPASISSKPSSSPSGSSRRWWRRSPTRTWPTSSHWSVICRPRSTPSSGPAPALPRPDTKDRSPARVRLDHARTLLQANLLEEAVEAADRAVIESEATEGDLELAESLLVAAEAHLASGDITARGRHRKAQRRALHRARPPRLGGTGPIRPAAGAAGQPSQLEARRADGGQRPNAPPVRLPPRSRPPPPGRCGAAHRAAPRRAGQRAAGREQAGPPGARRSSGRLPSGSRPPWSCCAAGHSGRVGRSTRASGSSTTTTRSSAPSSCERSPRRRASVWPASASNSLSTIGRARELLDHLEATRRTVSLLPAAQPPDDEVLADLLARLRLVTAQHQDAISAGAPTDHFERERAALERRIRWHARRAPAGGEVTELTIGESLSLLGDRALVEYANLDGRLYAVSVIGGRSVLHDLGVGRWAGRPHRLVRRSRCTG